MADSKLSELSSVSSATSSDLLYIVTGGQSRKISAGALAASMNIYPKGGGIVHITGSSTVTSAGTSNTTSWFSFDSTLYWGARLNLGARDIDNTSNDAHYIGMFWSTVSLDGSVDGADLQSHLAGGNQITIPEPVKIGDMVYFYFNRQSSTTNRIKVAYEAELYLR